MIFPCRVVPYTNSWNLSGWIVEQHFPLTGYWVPMSRMYLTCWGARWAARRRERADFLRYYS